MNRSLSLAEKLCYATGQIGVSLMNIIFVLWVMYFYAPPEDDRKLIPLVPVAATGLVLWLGRVVDAVTDPLIAAWSDKFRSRLGRRRPFILAGAPLTFLVFVLLWLPPVRGVHTANLLFLILLSGLFWTFYTAATIPYTSLLPEIASAERERLSLSAFMASAMVVGNAVGFGLSGVLIEKHSFPAMALICGGLALGCYAIAGLFVRERVTVDAAYQKLNFRQALLATLGNRPFMIYLVAFLAFQFGFNILASGIPYITTVLLRQPAGKASLIMGVSFGAILIYCPLVMKLAGWMGMKKLFSLCMLLMAACFSAMFFFGKLPLPLSLVAQGYLLMFLTGFPVAGFFVLQNPLIAEIVDYDEKLSGLRREGIYYGVQGFFMKFAIGLAGAVAGFLFHRFGYSVAHDLGVRLLGPTAALFILLAFVLFQRYPLGGETRIISP